MAQQYVRLNLASSIYPFYSDIAGRTINVPQLDQNFDRFNQANSTPDKGVPQVFYLHNVVPISNGFQSVGYDKSIEGLAGNSYFDTAYTLYSYDFYEGFHEPPVLFVPAGGRNYIYNPNSQIWESIEPITPLLTPGQNVSVATVRDVSYIFYPQLGVYTYSSLSQTFVLLTLDGVDPIGAGGIFEAAGYLLLWTNNAVYWSSPANPIDFNPFNRTGAGGGNVQDVKGQINFCVKVPDGFIIFCSKNAVGATYTGNTDYPFIFKEINGSQGVRYPNDVAWQGNLPYFPGMSTAGIQQFAINQVIPTMQEVSDFLTSGLFEDFDDTTNTFSVTHTQLPIYFRFQSVGNKYIAISYGLDPALYTHAILYDVLLNRYGKLKIPHRYIFDFALPPVLGKDITYNMLMGTPINSLGDTQYVDFFHQASSNVQPKQNIGILQQDGTVYTVNFDIMNPLSNGTFIIGKFQHIRNNTIYHQITETETTRFPEHLETLILPTLNGKDFLPAIPAVVTGQGATMTRVAKRVAGKNFSVLLKGSYLLSTMIIRYTLGGWR